MFCSQQLHSHLDFHDINTLKPNMAPIKRTAHSDQNSNFLHEIISIRNTMQLAQQSLSRLERNLVKTPATSSTPKEKTPRRVLVEKLFNAEIPKRICWYHNRFGKAADPKNCPGPEFCNFVPPQIMTKAITKRIKAPKRPVTNNQTETSKNSITHPNQLNEILTEPNNKMDWNQQMDNEHQILALINKQRQDELESELLNISE